MPLKHFTETVLVVLLGLAAISAGAIVSVMPPIPEGFAPWTIVFAAALAYPAILYPLLKSSRADYSFRALHFAPVAVTIAWILIQIATLKEPRFAAANSIFTWGFGAMPVAAIFLLLASFCIRVIRRRSPRITFMVLLFAPFIAAAYISETRTHWDARLASVLWEGGPAGIAVDGYLNDRIQTPELSASSHGEKNLSHSSVPMEEAWRRKLRSVEQKKANSDISVAGTVAGVDAALNLVDPQFPVVVVGTKRIAKKPMTRLPKSGGGTEAIGILALAGFAGTMHIRARRRTAE